MNLRYVVGATLALALAQPAAADDTELEASSPRARHAMAHAVQRDRLQARVEALARELDLDTPQQLEVRRLLERQRREVGQIWEDTSVPAAWRVHATRLLSEQTSDRIRALLTDAQKQKFSKARVERGAPPGSLGGRTLDDWISLATPP